MNKENEEQQLLQDASTLLMFANVAARQGPPGSVDSQTTQSQQDLTSPPTTTPGSSQPLPPHPKPSLQTFSHPSMSGHGLPHTAPQRSYFPFISSPPLPREHHQNQPHQEQYNQRPETKLPSLQNSISSMSPSMHQPHVTLPFPTQRSHLPSQPQSIPPPHQPQPPQQPQRIPQSPQTSSPSSQQQHQRFQLPQSLSPPIHKPEPSANISPNLAKSKSQDHESSDNVSKLPAKGSFRTHRKTSSGSAIPSPGFQRSPAPANVALSRGINVESGQRNTDNAMIAAAALAAAADIPLPLKKAQAKAKTEENKASQATEERKLSEKDDGVATEPEEDDKTDDEPARDEEVPKPDVHPASAVSTTAPIAPENRDISPTTKEPEAKPEAKPEAQPEAKPEVKAEAEAKTDKEPSEKPVQFKPPPLESYRVDPDAGVIGCICGIEEDDGYTIQCDVCFRWQHCSCMGYKTNDQVPEDEYKCYYCDEAKWGKFDPAVCKADTIARLELDKAPEAQDPKVEPSSKRKSSGGSNSGSAEDKKKRKVEKNNTVGTDRPGYKRKTSNPTVNGSASSVSVNSAVSPSANNIVEINNKDNEQLEDGVTAESYQGLYFRLGDYDYKTPQVRSFIDALATTYETSTAKTTISDIETVPMAMYKTMKFSKVILPNHQRYLQERNELMKNKGYNKTSVQVKPYNENPKQKFSAISKLGFFISDRTSGGKETTVPAGTTVIEYLGELDRFESYVKNPSNHYSSWGTVKPKVVKVDLKVKPDQAAIPFTIDARFVGNEARFIRKSCFHTANCEIKPIYIPQTRKFKFIVVTTKPITLAGENADEELRLPWEWDEAHPIRKMLTKDETGSYKEAQKFEDFSDDEKALLISGVDSMLGFVECACNTTSLSSTCSLFKVKKATSYLLRSTRKASSLSYSLLNRSKEELVLPKKAKEYVSWKDRLIERDEQLHSALFSLGSPEDSAGSASEDEKPALEGTPDSVHDDDVHSAKEKILKDKNGFFKTPFKRQLLSRQDLPAQKYHIVPAKTGVDYVSQSTPKTLAVPVIPEIARSSREIVNEKLKPMVGEVKISPAKEEPIAALPERKPSGTTATVPKPEENAEPSHKPSVVKKLSFADYKKKMK